jgi:uncharacterized protein with GYD domain
VVRVEALDFVQLDLGVLGPVHGPAGHPPLGTGQACGQVGASPGIISLLWPATLGDDFAVGRLPEPDRRRLAAKHNGVIPAPHHNRAARYLSDGYQMTRRDPLPPRRRELRCVPDGGNLALGQDLAGILFDTEHDAAAESWGNQGACRRSSHSSSMPGPVPPERIGQQRPAPGTTRRPGPVPWPSADRSCGPTVKPPGRIQGIAGGGEGSRAGTRRLAKVADRVTGIAFMKWTERGRRTYQATVDRVEPALKLAGNLGVEVKEIYWTPGGPYDLIGIAEGPDMWSLSSFALALQSIGNLTVTWVMAYRPEQMREVIAAGSQVRLGEIFELPDSVRSPPRCPPCDLPAPGVIQRAWRSLPGRDTIPAARLIHRCHISRRPGVMRMRSVTRRCDRRVPDGTH